MKCLGVHLDILSFGRDRNSLICQLATFSRFLDISKIFETQIVLIFFSTSPMRIAANNSDRPLRGISLPDTVSGVLEVGMERLEAIPISIF